MKLHHVYSILCEDVRLEVAQKFTLIGVLPEGVASEQFPLKIRQFAYFQRWHADAPGTCPFRAVLINADTGNPVAGTQDVMNIVAAGTVVGTITFNDFALPVPGRYCVLMSVEGQRDFRVGEFVAVAKPLPAPAP